MVGKIRGKKLMGEKLIKKKIVIAMSGGVDSSVAALLLKKQGFDLVGVFMKLWKEPGRTVNRCGPSDSEKRARQVAKILNIPFRVFNLKKEFKKRIVECFLKENKKGLTPNPCVVCNKEIKFGLLLGKALKLDADYIATGHYARLGQEILNCKYKLLKAKDTDKDQSYFLWRLNQRQLKRVLFPVGNYTRAEVEKTANKFKLPFAGVRKSQEICFIQTTVDDFFKKYLKTRPGRIVDNKGKMLGSHQGLWFYTIGQRKGIKLPAGPFYVLDKDLKRNVLIVTKNEKDLYKKEIIVKNCNFISDEKIKLPFKMAVKIRYCHRSAPARIYKIQNIKYYIRFNKAQRAITPGQSAVFYKKQELLGGGIIC